LLIMYKGVRQSPGKVHMHAHPFWQLEIVTRHRIGFSMDGQRHVLTSGDMALIPPHTEHEFIYDHPGAAWISLKFERNEQAGGAWGGIIRHSLFTDKFTASLQTMVTGTILKPFEKTFVDGWIESLFAYVGSEDFLQSDDASGEFVRSVTDLVKEMNGKPARIGELAVRMSYTRGHLSRRFKSLTGENLKTYIDRIRLEKAKELLRYSEWPVSEIARELGFKDLFAFSRFFKRHTGIGPRDFRRRNGEA